MRAVLTKLGLAGRTTRTALLVWLLLAVVVSLLLWFLVIARLRENAESGGTPSIGALPLWLASLELAFALLLLRLAVGRFHDQGRPGWLALLPPAIYAFSTFVTYLPYVEELMPLVLLAGLLLPPTIGPNPYGPDPRGWASRDDWLAAQIAQRETGA